MIVFDEFIFSFHFRLVSFSLVSVLFVYAMYNIMYTHSKMANECINKKKKKESLVYKCESEK